MLLDGTLNYELVALTPQLAFGRDRFAIEGACLDHLTFRVTVSPLFYAVKHVD